MKDLPIIQQTYDLVKWYVPLLNRLPRNHKFTLGERMVMGLYELLEGLIKARFTKDKLELLEGLNLNLDILRYQTRLLMDFELISTQRYGYAASLLESIGAELGGWIKQQRPQDSSQRPSPNDPAQRPRPKLRSPKLSQE